LGVKSDTQMFDFQKAEQGDDRLVITPPPENNDVANPDHYNKGVSPYDVARTMFGASGLQKFVLINSIKYIQRYPHKHKGDTQKQLADLIKARQSLDTAIELHKELYGNGTVRHG
jgi:hypothetical protein